ncbi:hypothetical protein [Nocardioides sp. GCM10030258]|uniref:hypothetical protein n=1 Tax=unclassified Nocardioides TaxID=2615069 RepID=UPI00362269C5
MPGYRKLPEYLRSEVASCTSDSLFIGTFKTVMFSTVAAGGYAHLGLEASGDQIVASGAVLPEASRGRWSKLNLIGRVVVRKDLPKITKDFGGWYTPNFGDPSKGEHYVSITREVYQKQTQHGLQMPLLVDAQVQADGKVKIGVRVNRAFSRNDTDSPDLHLAASLVRENLGEAHAIASDLSVDDWLQDQIVGWELLPVGEGCPMVTVDEIVERVGGGLRPDKAAVLRERLDAMTAFGPTAVIVGREGFRRYVGYQFKADLVVLENFDYGNAVYVLYSGWETDSSRPRLELIADPDANFDRVIHRRGWQGKVEHLLRLHGHAVS